MQADGDEIGVRATSTSGTGVTGSGVVGVWGTGSTYGIKSTGPALVEGALTVNADVSTAGNVILTGLSNTYVQTQNIKSGGDLNIESSGDVIIRLG